MNAGAFNLGFQKRWQLGDIAAIPALPPQRYLRCVIWPHMSVEPLLSGQILCVLLERERVELRGCDSRMTWGGPRHNTGEHHGHGNADQDDFAHLTVPLTMRRFVFKPPLR
jgi:hypothetical protein